jgi:Amt family ammonium transporter
MGAILLGVFALKSVNPNGANGLITGNFTFFGWQVLATVVCATYAFVATFLILKLINLFGEIRVPDSVELRGLDETEFGETAYDLT